LFQETEEKRTKERKEQHPNFPFRKGKDVRDWLLQLIKRAVKERIYVQLK